MKDNLEDAPLHLDCGVSGLIEQASQVAVTIGRAGAMSFPRGHILARAYSHPGGKVSRRGKYRLLGAGFGDDLLRRLHPWVGQLG